MGQISRIRNILSHYYSNESELVEVPTLPSILLIEMKGTFLIDMQYVDWEKLIGSPTNSGAYSRQDNISLFKSNYLTKT